ncbi:phage tail assembly protein [Desulfobaculum sp. SPO524]|uniref:phage tail assembly protein n=1 Tax=Desulfobaculum sp. SPO524 TaxID=3378071 RepID=UPI0038534DD3
MSKERITLDHPVTWQGQEIAALDMRRPKVRDVAANEERKGTDVQKEISLFADLCEVSVDVLEDMDMADYRKLQQAYTGFLS